MVTVARMNSAYIWLLVAIVCEVIATSCLKLSEGFTRIVPSAITALGYAISFYCLSQTLRSLNMGVVYAMWSGVGIVLISVVGWLWMDQRLDGWALLGLGMIVAGVLVINLMSKTVAH